MILVVVAPAVAAVVLARMVAVVMVVGEKRHQQYCRSLIGGEQNNARVFKGTGRKTRLNNLCLLWADKVIKKREGKPSLRERAQRRTKFGKI
jgi:hypothetical protein